MNGDDGLAPERGAFRWGERDRGVHGNSGKVVLVRKKGEPPMRTHLDRPALDDAPALGDFIVGGASGMEAIILGERDSFWGVAATAVHHGPTGEITVPCPNPGPIVALWTRDRIGSLMFMTASGVSVIWIISPVNAEVVVRAQWAAARLLDAWLHRHDRRPLEFAPSRWRGGLVVSYPSSERVAEIGLSEITAGPVSDRSASFQAQDLIEEAAAIEIPTVEVPPVLERERGGLVERFTNLFAGR